jgi:hypothetical protein
MSQQGGGTDYDTVSSSSGTLYLQNANVNITGAGAATTLTAPIVNATTVNATTVNATTVSAANLTLGGTTVSGIATGPSGYNNSVLATKGYVDARIDKVARGVAMTAALETPTIEPGDNNAIKLSAAGFDGTAGLSFGYARRICKGISADVEAAADSDFKDGVVRGGINYSF